MQHYFDNVQDFHGNAQAGVSVLVKTAAGAVATIYSDDGVTQKANPLTTAGDGGFDFYAANGKYTLNVGSDVTSITLFDIDDLEDVDTATPTSASTVLGETGGVVRRFAKDSLGPFVNVKDPAYGAVGDETTDDSAAFTAAFAAADNVLVPDGTFVVNSVTMAGKRLFGTGTIKKKAGTSGAMLSGTGSNVIEGVTLDYDWQNASQSQPYTSNNIISQVGGSLKIRGASFDRSFTSAVVCLGGSLYVSDSTFTRGAPHNDLTGGNERPTDYIRVNADSLMDGSETVSVDGCHFVGPSLSDAHLNPGGVFLTDDGAGVRYKNVKITGNTFIACGQNAGNANVTGAIDTYNGCENLVISGNTIRLFSYAGIKVQNSSKFSITGNTVIDGQVPAGAYYPYSIGITTDEKVRSSTVEQSDGTVIGNTLTSCQYLAIHNSCDNVNIVGNTIDTVTLSTLGTGINNTGAAVNIAHNVMRAVGGSFINTTGSSVNVDGNLCFADAVAGAGAVEFSGADVKIRGNTFESSAGSAYAGIRTNGLASKVQIDGNRVVGYNYGTDIRTTNGAVDQVDIGLNLYESIGTAEESIGAAATNVSRRRRELPIVSAVYDPPSLAAGAWDTERTVTVTGAALGDEVYAVGVRDMKGLEVRARVSAADTVTYVVMNPAGNPQGTQDLGNTGFRFRVVKTA